MASSSASNNTLTSVVQSFQNLAQTSTEFTWAMAVFGVSQAGKVWKGLPTARPAETANASFTAVTRTVEAQYDPLDTRVFDALNPIRQTAIDTAFGLANPSNYTPQKVAETSVNLVRWGFGLAAQLVPGGEVGSGGPSTGWGPVNHEDAQI